MISVLNKQGRGHGEYNSLGWWCYSTEHKTLYVENDESLLCYSVPDFTFTGKIEENIYPIETFGDFMFYAGPDEENNDSTIEKNSLYKYSLSSGQKTRIRLFPAAIRQKGTYVLAHSQRAGFERPVLHCM